MLQCNTPPKGHSLRSWALPLSKRATRHLTGTVPHPRPFRYFSLHQAWLKNPSAFQFYQVAPSFRSKVAIPATSKPHPAGIAHPAACGRTPALRAGARRAEYAEAKRNAYEVRSIYRFAGEL